MSQYGNESPIEEYGRKRPRRHKKPAEISQKARKWQLPLEQYSSDDRSMIIITMITIGVVAMIVFMVLLGAVRLMNVTLNLVFSLLAAVAVVASTHETVLRHYQDEQTVETKLSASRITASFAAKFDKRNPGDHEVKWLLPGDLRNLYYDDRHHVVFLREIFKEMFAPRYEGKHRLWHAFRNMGITMLVVALTTTVIAAWPLQIRTGSGIGVAFAVGLMLVVAYVLVGLWYCLRHIRMIVTRRITAEIWDTLPWIKSRQAFIFTHTITETSFEQGFWGKRLRYSDHIIDTVEIKPKITEWKMARKGQQLDYAFNVFAKKPEQTD